LGFTKRKGPKTGAIKKGKKNKDLSIMTRGRAEGRGGGKEKGGYFCNRTRILERGEGSTFRSQKILSYWNSDRQIKKSGATGNISPDWGGRGRRQRGYRGDLYKPRLREMGRKAH